jgi:mycothiol system anti-sigma-R factor
MERGDCEMDCKRVGQMVFLFFDNEMTDADLAPFRAHVESCPPCAHKIDYTEKLLLLFRHRCARCSAPVTLRRRILVSFQHRRGLT